MKKYIYYLLTIIFCTSCGEDFLNLSPTDQANTNDFYASPTDFETALIGAYGYLNADLFIYISDVRSDNAKALANAGNYQRLSEFNAGATNGLISSAYRDCFRAIQASNTIIERIEGADFDDTEKDLIAGEAKFIRALSYFYLINFFGDVPLLLDEVTGANLDAVRSISRTPVTEVYTQIVKDLTEAEQELSDIKTPNRASAYAAKVLLGKVYLFQKDYSAAAAKLNEVITSDQLELEPDFSDLFQIGNANNSESIFVVEYLGSANGTGSNLPFFTAPAGLVGSFTLALQIIYVEPNLNAAYLNTTDARLDMSAKALYAPDDEGSINDSVYVTTKYVDNNPFENNNASCNAYILRYADVLLMRAEALNEIGYSSDGEAFDHLNEIRDRAGLGSLDATDLPNQAAFRDAVIKERRLELAMEGHRWFDLVRTGTAISIINAVNPSLVTIDQNDLLYPIPQREIDINPDVIKQNPGY